MVEQSTRAVVLHSGAHVIASDGRVVVIDMVLPDGTVLGRGAWDRMPRRIAVRGDAWGGEADQATGLSA